MTDGRTASKVRTEPVFPLTPLPYAADALAPVLSDETLKTHHGKHHAKYVDTMNALLAEHEHGPFSTVEDVVRHAAKLGEQKLFNNAGQAWNHGFFWSCMTPDHAAPEGPLAEAIERDLGGLKALRAAFVDEGATHFASGWAWVVVRDGKLEVISTHDADTALVAEGVFPILVCDVWEHAYYLDHKQDRKGFLEAWFDRLANWSFAASQYEAATGGGEGWTYPRAG